MFWCGWIIEPVGEQSRYRLRFNTGANIDKSRKKQAHFAIPATVDHWLRRITTRSKPTINITNPPNRGLVVAFLSNWVVT